MSTLIEEPDGLFSWEGNIEVSDADYWRSTPLIFINHGLLIRVDIIEHSYFSGLVILFDICDDVRKSWICFGKIYVGQPPRMMFSNQVFR